MKAISISFWIIFITSCLSFNINAQEYQVTKGKDFWLAFSWEKFYEDAYFFLHFNSYEKPSSIEVSIPLQGWTEEINLNEWEIKTISLPLLLLNPDLIGEAMNTGIHITSNNDISVKALHYCPYKSDATEILPTPMLGQSYQVVSHHGSFHGRSTAMIVAVEDNTTIEIKPTADLGGDSILLSPILNAGETYQLIALGENDDLTGTQITSCKPIAVFGAASFSGIPDSDLFSGCCQDRLWTQLYPESSWSKGPFYVIPYDYPNGNEPLYALKFFARNDQTQVFINGDYEFTIFNKIPVTWWEQTDDMVITTDSPINIHKFMYKGGLIAEPSGTDSIIGDPNIVTINPISSMVSLVNHKVFGISDNFAENFINIIIKREDQEDVTVNGNQYLPNVNYISYDDKYVAFAIPVSPHLSYEICAPNGLLANAYGIDEAHSYSFNLDFQLPLPSSIHMNLLDTICLNESTTFSFNHPPDAEITSVNWNFGDGISSDNIIPDHIYQSPGKFTVQLKVATEDCQDIILEKEIFVHGTYNEELQIYGSREVNPIDTFLYTIPTIHGSKYFWEIENATIIQSNQYDSVYVTWDETKEGAIMVTEESKEGCQGNSFTLFIQQHTPCFPVFHLSPNPTTKELHLSFTSLVEKETRAYVINLNGQLVHESLLDIQLGKNEQILDLEYLASGLYIVRISNGKCQEVGKFVKVKE